jgi:hypothetical protein
VGPPAQTGQPPCQERRERRRGIGGHMHSLRPSYGRCQGHM